MHDAFSDLPADDRAHLAERHESGIRHAISHACTACGRTVAWEELFENSLRCDYCALVGRVAS